MGLTVRLTDVIAIEISDTPGGFASALNVLKDRDVEIEYAYAFISRDEGRACVILRVDDNDKAFRRKRCENSPRQQYLYNVKEPARSLKGSAPVLCYFFIISLKIASLS